MSYDVSMRIDTGGEYLAEVCEVGNMTYTVAPMFCLALGEGGLRGLDGSSGLDAIARLERAVSHIRHPENAAAYRELNPSNGWGSHDGAAAFLEKLLAACRAHPKAVIYVS